MLRTMTLMMLIALPRMLWSQTIQPPAAQQTAPPSVSGTPKPSAVVRGHVYAADSGTPLRGAQVRIGSAEGNTRISRLAATDANGAYEFTELPAGRYNVTAMKGAFVTLSYGQTRPFAPGQALDVADAQLMERVDIALPRGSVIAGRIVDEYGDPVTRVMVSAMRVGGGRREPETTRTTRTDDLGEYRLFALPPSDYIVQATAQMGNGGPQPESADDQEGYTTTFFPGVIEARDARRITLGIGQIVEDFSFVMQSARGARVSGTVVDSKGQPFSGMLMVMRKSNGAMFGNGWPIRPDGTFAVANMAPGQYTLEATRFFNDEPEVASLPITVAGEDIADLRIVTAPYVTARGRVVADPAMLQQSPLSGVTINVVPAEPDDIFPGPVKPARVNDDLTFEVKSPPGRMRFRLTGQAAGVDVRAVRAGGVDVTDDGVELRPGAAVRDIEIELTNRSTTVMGLVANARGEAARDYTVVLFARDQNRWKIGSRYVKVGRPDQDARFKVSGLPPGEYYAVALESVESGRWYDRDFLERVQRDASMFSLIEGETKSLDLKLQISR